MGSGGLLGPLPDTFWINKITNIFLTEIAPNDLYRPPRQIPDDPKQLQQMSNECQRNVKILGPSCGPDH